MGNNRLENSFVPPLPVSDGEGPIGSRTVRRWEATAGEELREREVLLHRYLRRPDTLAAIVKQLSRPAAEWVGVWEIAEPPGVSSGPLLWLRAPTLDHARRQRDRKLEEERDAARERRRLELAELVGAPGRVSSGDAGVDRQRGAPSEARERMDDELEREYEAKRQLAVAPVFRHFSSPGGGFSLWRDASTGVPLDGDTASVFVDAALTAAELPAALQRLTAARCWDPGPRSCCWYCSNPEPNTAPRLTPQESPVSGSEAGSRNGPTAWRRNRSPVRRSAAAGRAPPARRRRCIAFLGLTPQTGGRTL